MNKDNFAFSFSKERMDGFWLGIVACIIILLAEWVWILGLFVFGYPLVKGWFKIKHFKNLVRSRFTRTPYNHTTTQQEQKNDNIKVKPRTRRKVSEKDVIDGEVITINK